MSDQGDTYGAFIATELDREHDRRTALDARALTVTTASTAFVGLVGAGTVLVFGQEHEFSPWTLALLSFSLGMLAVAGLLSLLAYRPRVYDVVTGGTMREMTAEHWADPEVDARNVVAHANVLQIERLRKGNNDKAYLLVWAGTAQVLGLAALTLSIVVEAASL